MIANRVNTSFGLSPSFGTPSESEEKKCYKNDEGSVSARERGGKIERG
jgi:hypothetical protein